MSTQQSADFRATLREQLAVAGPAALEMLAGAAPLDAAILIAAAQAAGLLDHVTVGEPALRSLRSELVDALARSSRVALALDQLELSTAAYTLDVDVLDDQQETLHQLVSLAGLAEALPEALAVRVEAPLVLAEGTALMAPDRVAPLAPLAAWLSDQLDLDDGHRVHLLLSAVEDAVVGCEAALDEAAMARGMAAAAARARRPRLAAWIELLSRISPGLVEPFHHGGALVARCAAEQPRTEAHPVRVEIESSDPEGLYLTAHDRRLFLEWDGPEGRAPERATLEPGGIELEEEQELFEPGTRLWSMSLPPATSVRRVRLHRGGGWREVAFGED